MICHTSSEIMELSYAMTLVDSKIMQNRKPSNVLDKQKLIRKVILTVSCFVRNLAAT